MEPRAQNLYDHMVAHRQWKVEEPVIYFYEFPEGSVLPEEELKTLKQKGWIKGTQKKTKFLLGQGIISFLPFGQESGLQDSIDMCLSQYSSFEKQILEQLFSCFTQRQKREMTLNQKLVELKYYAGFRPSRVIRSAQTYLSLRQDQQFGTAYMRGIIRNDQQEQETPQAAFNVRTIPQFTSSVTAKAEKSQWIRDRIDLTAYSSLDEDGKSSYLRSLEEEYDAQASA